MFITYKHHRPIADTAALELSVNVVASLRQGCFEALFGATVAPLAEIGVEVDPDDANSPLVHLVLPEPVARPTV